MDWQTVVSRRARKEPPRQGRLEHLLHHQHHARRRQSRPNSFTSGACDKAWFGWPCDPEMEKLRAAFMPRGRSRQAEGSSARHLRPRHGPGASTSRSASTRRSAPTARTALEAGCPARCRWSGTSARRTDDALGRAASERAVPLRTSRLTPPARAALPASAAPLRRPACRAPARCGTRWRRCPRCPGRHWPAPWRRARRRCG